MNAGPLQAISSPEARPKKHARSVRKSASAVKVSQVPPFGPQTHWSYLVSQRELLQDEIDRGRRCLEHLRKDIRECTTVFGSWPGSSVFKTWTATTTPADSGAKNQKNDMEDSLDGWLQFLEQRLGYVTEEIDALIAESRGSHQDAEESMFALLRAAG
jgi:hypothetical protein